MKIFLKTFERLFVYYFSSMGIALLFEVLLNLPLKFLLGKNFNNLTSFFIGMTSLMIALLLLFYKDGFRHKKFQLTLLLLLIIVIYFIGRAVYISGPTDYLARYILYLTNPSMINGKIMLNQYCMILMICAYAFLYAPIILIAEYIGVKRSHNQFKK